MKAWPALVLVAVLAAACSDAGLASRWGMASLQQSVARTGGGASVARGRQLIAQAGCGNCHTVPGVAGADGRVAPPLLWFASRTYIAGELPNSYENLVRWLKNPAAVEPGTAMPDVGLTDAQARDIAAYLETLE